MEPLIHLTPDVSDELERVRVARVRAEESQLAFECAVDEAVNAGYSLRAVGISAGMTHTGVSKLIERLFRTGRSLGLERTDGRWVRGGANGRVSLNLPPYDREF